jgi:hypothetical protein
MLEYFSDGLKHNYRQENTDLYMKLATLTNVVKEYEKKFGKLYTQTVPKEEKEKK